MGRRAAYQDIPRPVPSVVHLDTPPGSRILAFRSARTKTFFAEIFHPGGQPFVARVHREFAPKIPADVRAKFAQGRDVFPASKALLTEDV